MSKIICIYHSKDLDGLCSGAIVKLKFPDAEMIGYDYGEAPPFKMDDLNEAHVIMIDVSMPMEAMQMIGARAKQFTWIDHHVSANKDYNESFLPEVRIDGMHYVYNSNKSACQLGWEYFFPITPMPAAVSLLGRYDTWKNENKEEWNEAILPFQYGMRFYCKSVDEFNPKLFKINNTETDFHLRAITNDGRIILKYEQGQNERSCKSSFVI